MTVRRAAVLALLVFVAACHRRRPPPNVLVIVADTLRADRLATYGNTEGLTPFIDSLAARAHVFRHAYAESPWTLPSVATILTSRFAWQHGVVRRQSVLADTEHTLAEVLSGHGYATGLFTANVLMRPQSGLAQGFDEYRVVVSAGDDGKPAAGVVNHAALAWLDGLRLGTGNKRRMAPVLLYLQYMEPHLPYTPPPAVLDRVLKGRPRPDLAELNALTPVLQFMPDLDERLPAIWDGYNASVASLDTAVYALFIELGDRGFLDDAIVLFTADHGEEFREHGRFGHGEALYGEAIHVPLIVQLPGDRQRTDVTDVVSLLDVAPTVLAAAGIPPPPSFEGMAWTAAPGRSGPRPVYSEVIPQNVRTMPTRAVIAGTKKLIVAEDGSREAYDLAADPKETNPHAFSVADDGPLGPALASFEERLAGGEKKRVAQPLDDDTKARLRALGYTD